MSTAITLSKPVTVDTENLSMLKVAELQDGMQALTEEKSYVKRLKGQAELISAFTPDWTVDEILNLNPEKFNYFIQQVTSATQGTVPNGKETNS